jgi:hypothetical protein
MSEELQGLYGRVKDQFEEIQVLKAKLAKYELGPAMAAQVHISEIGRRPNDAGIGCDPVQNTTNGALPSKLPWE